MNNRLSKLFMDYHDIEFLYNGKTINIGCCKKRSLDKNCYYLKIDGEEFSEGIYSDLIELMDASVGDKKLWEVIDDFIIVDTF